MMTIMANEVKMKGVSIFDALFEKFSEVIINVRGKNKYCVIPFDDYEAYRNYKIDMAYKEVKQDIERGKFHNDIHRHFGEIEEALENG